MKAKKSFGQHFLNDTHIAQKIADSLIHTDAYNNVLEVGPGMGMLTQFLMEKPYELKMVEADHDMIFYLNEHFPNLTHKIIYKDFLKLRFDTLFDDAPFAIIGNFPYNISSQIVFRSIEHRKQIPELVGMFQREMAERVVSPPGSKTYGVISVITQAFYHTEYLFTVKPGSFRPPPKVFSAVIRLTRKKNQDLDCDEVLFKRIVKQAFSQRRKMLRNTMKTFAKGNSLLEKEFFNQRPEVLGVQDFVLLTNWISDILND